MLSEYLSYHWHLKLSESLLFLTNNKESSINLHNSLAWIQEYRNRNEIVLQNILNTINSDRSEILYQAMCYSVLNGGKRIRATLIYVSGLSCQFSHQDMNFKKNALDNAAAAVELIHSYSLIHDDLPCMDNAKLRRGKPALHIKFGEAVALLAGDALQSLAFELLADMPIDPKIVIETIKILAHSSGASGMVCGQVIDLNSVNRKLSTEEIKIMYTLKTGSLFSCSLSLGAVIAGLDKMTREALDLYSRAIGLAFQVVDDILDATEDIKFPGKKSNRKNSESKPTYISILGLEQARLFAQSLRKTACHALVPIGGRLSDRLLEIADLIVFRNY